MCDEYEKIAGRLSEEEIREALENGEDDSPLPWSDVLSTMEQSGMTNVMVLLNRQVEGLDTDGFSMGDIGRALERELRSLLCTRDKKYSKIRAEISKSKRSAREVGIAIATAIASSWHLQAGLLTPFILVFIMAVSRIGVEAWCSGISIETANSKGAQVSSDRPA